MDININQLIWELSQPKNPNKPWTTARMLAKRIGATEEDMPAIEECLLKHCTEAFAKGRMPLVRYSTLPSKETLEVLWGHTDFVGNRKLSGIRKTDVADSSLNVEKDVKKADLFLSHSFKDYGDVMRIAKMLQEEGVSAWLAETHIAKDEHINEEVIQALSNTAFFGLYLSDNSLSSKWTGKEYGYARAKGSPIIVVADCRSDTVRAFLKGTVQGNIDRNGLSGNAAHFFQDLFTDKEGLTRFVVYPESYWNQFKDVDDTFRLYPIQEMVNLIKPK